MVLPVSSYKTEFPCATCKKNIHILASKLVVSEKMGFTCFVCDECWEGRPGHVREINMELTRETMWTVHKN